MPTRADLARWLSDAGSRAAAHRQLADHLVSEAIYLDDPEGNGVEVYADRPPARSWIWTDGVVTMGPIRSTSSTSSRCTKSSGRMTPATARRRPAHRPPRYSCCRRDRVARQRVLSHGRRPASRTFSRRDATFLSSGGYHHHVAANVWECAAPVDATMRDRRAVVSWRVTSRRPRRSAISAARQADSDVVRDRDRSTRWGELRLAADPVVAHALYKSSAIAKRGFRSNARIRMAERAGHAERIQGFALKGNVLDMDSASSSVPPSRPLSLRWSTTSSCRRSA